MPPKNGSRAGVSHTLSSHAPLPVNAWMKVMYDGVDVGPLLAIDLDRHEVVV